MTKNTPTEDNELKPKDGSWDDATWQKIMNQLDLIFGICGELHVAPEATSKRLKDMLAHGTDDYDYALRLLPLLNTDFTAQVAPYLVGSALSHRDALVARELLGRLPHEQAAKLVSPRVDRLLDAHPDDDAYRRMAELLLHLGLYNELARLCDKAAASSDPDIREVAEDFRANTNIPASAELTEVDLQVIEERAQASSPAPWEVFLESDGGTGGCNVIRIGGFDDSQADMYVYRDGQLASDADFTFIADARQDVPRLIAEIRKLKKALAAKG